MKKSYFIQSEPTNEPVEIHIILGKKPYSEPKLYIPKETQNGNKKPTVKPGKRWYVYLYWLNPKTNKRDIKIKFYREINKLKTVTERKEAGNALIEAVKIAIQQGWVPKQVRDLPVVKKKEFTIVDAIEYAFEIKNKSLTEATVNDYKVRKDFFVEWLKSKALHYKSIRSFTIDDFYNYLDFLQLEYKQKNGKPLSNTSIDNYKRSISALFTELQHKRIIDHNFINDIPKLKSKPIKNKPFTKSELEKIIEEIKKTDPYLLNFVGLMIFALLRPREIIRLTVSDINTEDWILGVERKNKPIGYSRIIEKLKPFVKSMQLDDYPGNYHLITKYNKPEVWETEKLSSKVNLFGKRFKKILDKLCFGDNYGMYSLRHTAILDMYQQLNNQNLGEQEIIFKLLPYTGHKTPAGLKNYLRDIQGIIPEDHSSIYSIDIKL